VYVTDTSNNRIQEFSTIIDAVKTASWGRIKQLYR
jgi:hypothetical protein